MLTTPDKLEQVVKLYDESTPEMKRGLFTALIDRVSNAESVLAALDIETRGLKPTIRDRNDALFMKAIVLQVGSGSAWLIHASKVHPYT